MKKLLLVQPGPFGDIFVCAPIAKWYADRGYEVHWPVTKKFISTLKYFNYVEPILLSDEEFHPDWLRSDVMKIIPLMDQYDKVLNLADRGPHPTAQQPNENFEQCKYRLAEVPFTEKNNLSFTRNFVKERVLFDKFSDQVKTDYAAVHLADSRDEVAELPNISLPVVDIKLIDGYNIQDWYSILTKAREIYCVESAPHQFMDGIVEDLTKDRFLLRRPVVPAGVRFTVSKHWDLKHIGEDSIIRG